MSEPTMTQAEAEQEIIDILLMAFHPKGDPKPDSTMAALGFNGFEVLEVQLVLEDRFGELVFGEFEPTVETTIAQLANIARKA